MSACPRTLRHVIDHPPPTPFHLNCCAGIGEPVPRVARPWGDIERDVMAVVATEDGIRSVSHFNCHFLSGWVTVHVEGPSR